MPQQICAESYLSAIQKFDDLRGGSTSLTHIHFVDVNDAKVTTVEITFKSVMKRMKAGDKSSKQLTAGDKSSKQLTAGDKSSKQLTADDKSSKQLTADDKSSKQLKAGDKSSKQLTAGDKSSKQLTADDKSSKQLTADDKSSKQLTAGDKSSPKHADSLPVRCGVCLDTPKQPKTLDKCGHAFCSDCLDQRFAVKPVCPDCQAVYGTIRGNQPQGGKMKMYRNPDSLPGFPKDTDTFVIDYSIPSGVQSVSTCFMFSLL